MRRKSMPSMSLVVALAASLGGCDSDPGAKVVQRDVYSGPHALEDCVADWGNADLCQKQLDAAERQQYQTASSTSHTNTILLWGPSYTGYDRATLYNGQTITPSATRAVHTASFKGDAAGMMKASSFSAPRPAGVSSAFTSRGGFGATGRSFGSGGS